MYQILRISNSVLVKSVLGKDGEREDDAGDPIELSILRSAYFAGIDIDAIKKDYPIVAEVPYSLYYKFMATIHEPSESIGVAELTGKYIVYAKGDPERMVELCSDQATGGNLKVLEPFDKSFWLKQVAILSSRGLRILALCRAVVSKTEIQLGEQLGPNFLDRQGNVWMTMVGLCAVVDPPRQECIQAIAEARGAGIRVAMITGDTKDTAVAIGNIIGLVDEECSSAITGPEMDVMSEKELEKSVMSNNVFALASPQNKIQIVEALQAQGQVCGMTGNGVNDAPALKAADIGIAMGLDGTDVAREAADMILVDDSYPTIVMAIKGGRVVWENLRKILLINIPINLSQGFSVLFGLLVGLPMPPLNVIQILYSNLICAMALSFVCAVEPAEEGIMNLLPRRVGKSLLGRYLSLRIAIATTAMTVFIVLSVYWLRSLGLENYGQLAQYAVAFNVLNFGAISIMLSARFAHNSSFSKRIFVGNKWCWIVVLIYVILQLGCTYIPGLNTVVFQMSPMDGIQWGITILFMVSMFIIMEVEKLIRLNVLHQKGGITDDDAEKWIFDGSNRKRKKASQLNPREVRQLGLRGSIR